MNKVTYEKFLEYRILDVEVMLTSRVMHSLNSTQDDAYLFDVMGILNNNSKQGKGAVPSRRAKVELQRSEQFLFDQFKQVFLMGHSWPLFLYFCLFWIAIGR